MWNLQKKAFSKDFHILQFDTRGHGSTSYSDGDYDFTLLANDVIALWDELKIRTSNFIGLSLGGTTGYVLAKNYPNRLLKIVLCDCRLDAPKEYIEGWKQRRNAVSKGGIKTIINDCLDRWFRPGFLEKEKSTYHHMRSMILSTSVKGYLGCTGALIKMGDFANGSKIKVPCLFIVGEYDGTLPFDMKNMHSAVSGSEFSIISNAAHLSNIENPVQFNNTVTDFLRT